MNGTAEPGRWRRGCWLCAAISLPLALVPVCAQTVSSLPSAAPIPADQPLDLQLEVFINGFPSGWIVPFRRTPDGRFLV